jgi:hypothetical protein
MLLLKENSYRKVYKSFKLGGLKVEENLGSKHIITLHPKKKVIKI